MIDVFISYSRRDKEFVQILHSALVDSKYKAWIDWQDILPTTDWWKEIEAGIEAAHTFIFVISKDSVTSKYCRKELDHAFKHNKRLIAILRRRDFSQEDISPKLSQYQWLMFQVEDDFDTSFVTLVETINTDLEHKKTHTRFEMRAIEWRQSDKDFSLLLQGSDLEKAEQWLLQASVGKEPKPTELQGEYIAASRKASVNRQRTLIGVLGSLLVLAVMGSGVALWQFGKANRASALAEMQRKDAELSRRAEVRQRQVAEQKQREAEEARTAEVEQRRQAQLAQQQAEEGEAKARRQAEIAKTQTKIALARRLAAQGGQVLNQPSYLTARNVLLAIEAMKRSLELRITSVAADQALRQGLNLLGEAHHILENSSNRMHMGTRYASKSIQNHDERFVAIQDTRDTVKIIDISTNEQVGHLEFPTNVSLHALGNNGEYIAVSPEDSRRLEIFHVESRQKILTTSMDLLAVSGSFSQSNRYLAISFETFGTTQESVIDVPIRIWDLQNGLEATRIIFSPPSLSLLKFSDDEDYLIIDDLAKERISFWRTNSNSQVPSLQTNYSIGGVSSDLENDLMAMFTHDLPSSESSLIVWSIDKQEVISKKTAYLQVKSIAFSENIGGFIVAGMDNDHKNIARILEIQSERIIQEIKFAGDSIEWIILGNNGEYAVIAGYSNTTPSKMKLVEVWNVLSKSKIRTIRSEALDESVINDITLSPQSEFISITNVQMDSDSFVWNLLDGHFLSAILDVESIGSATAFSSVDDSGKYIAIGNLRHHSARIFDLKTANEISSINHDDVITSISFNKDGSHFATSSVDGSARVWNVVSGQEVSRVNFGEEVDKVQFSLDGKYLITTLSGDNNSRINIDLWRPKDLIEEACSRLHRNLTYEEWAFFIGDEPYRKTCSNL